MFGVQFGSMMMMIRVTYAMIIRTSNSQFIHLHALFLSCNVIEYLMNVEYVFLSRRIKHELIIGMDKPGHWSLGGVMGK